MPPPGAGVAGPALYLPSGVLIASRMWHHSASRRLTAGRPPAGRRDTASRKATKVDARLSIPPYNNACWQYPAPLPRNSLRAAKRFATKWRIPYTPGSCQRVTFRFAREGIAAAMSRASSNDSVVLASYALSVAGRLPAPATRLPVADCRLRFGGSAIARPAPRAHLRRAAKRAIIPTQPAGFAGRDRIVV